MAGSHADGSGSPYEGREWSHSAEAGGDGHLHTNPDGTATVTDRFTSGLVIHEQVGPEGNFEGFEVQAEDGTKLYEDRGEPGDPGAAGDPAGYQTTLTEFGAVEGEALGGAGEGGAEAAPGPPHEHGELTPYLAEAADTMDTFNEAAGAVLGEAIGATVLAPLGPEGHVLGEMAGEAIGEGLKDAWYAAAEAVSDYVEGPHPAEAEAEASTSNPETSDSGYQTTLEDFGFHQWEGGDVADQASAAESGTDGRQASLSDFGDGWSSAAAEIPGQDVQEPAHDLQSPEVQDLQSPDTADVQGPEVQDLQGPDSYERELPDTAHDLQSPDTQDLHSPYAQDSPGGVHDIQTPDAQDLQSPGTHDLHFADTQDLQSPDSHDLQWPDTQNLHSPGTTNIEGLDTQGANVALDYSVNTESSGEAHGHGEAASFGDESSVSDVFASLADGDSIAVPAYSDVSDFQSSGSHESDVFAALAGESSEVPDAMYQDSSWGSQEPDFGGAPAAGVASDSHSGDVFAQLGADSFDSSGDYGWTDQTWGAGDQTGYGQLGDTGWDPGAMIPDTSGGGWDSGDGGGWDSGGGGWDSGGGGYG